MRGKGSRLAVSLACTECKSRNYKTNKAEAGKSIELRKFCRRCNRHTLHVETK